ncbi:LysE family translocator [Allorhizobium undicola]|uniref:LysE family translocator n=1 Tax=Allorhizobium undicola TaxID=78527 RepID=UPI00048460F5|nr:LysE family translocator [Allorhizobium undicola]
MSDIMQHLPQIGAAYMLYLVAVISPGPANIAIISTAIQRGRKSAFVIMLGIFCGSCTWALAAAMGLSALLMQYGQILEVLKIVGGLYMLYLAYKASRSLFAGASSADLPQAAPQASLRQLFLKGYAIHLTNPKAIFGWVATISLGLPEGSSPATVALIVGGCLATGFTIFSAYALLFSTARAARLYTSAKRPMDAAMALIFGAAGFKMLASAT